MRARVLVRPKEGILDPQGQAVERALPALGFQGVANVHVGRLIELDVEDPAQLPGMCERLLANPLIESYEIVDAAGAASIGSSAGAEPPGPDSRGGRGVRFGIVRFPGSCDDIDAQQAADRVGDTVLLWHRDHDLSGVDAVIVPGGFSYGDYLRPGAIARFSPLMEAVSEFAGSGGLVLGICNGFQVLCEAGLLPGALLRNTSLRFIFRQVELEVVRTDTPFTSACAPGERLSIPVKHTTGRYYAPDDQLDELERAGQVVLRYAPGHNPNGSVRDIAGVCNEARNVFGLMPHPEHAVDALTGSTDGLKLLQSMAAQLRVPAAA